MGIYLGLGPSGVAWTGHERSALVLGPSRSGKTSSLIVPNVLSADGAVVTTSTKPDVLQATWQARRERGWTMLFDPSGTVETPKGVERVGWSPVRSAETWDGALLAAESMVRTSRSMTNGSIVGSGDDHWTERAGSLLAPMLHAAALGGESMQTVTHWVDRHDGQSALEILADQLGDHTPPTDLLAGILSTEHREQSGIWSTSSGVLSAYRSTAVQRSTDGQLLDAHELCDGANTLYICAASRRQGIMAPLVVGALTEIRDATYDRHVQRPNAAPVLMALDEVANIAPLAELPSMVSEGPGQGLLVLACLQDLSQAHARWGRAAEGFISLFGTTVVMRGVGDVETLRAIAALAGEAEVPTRSIGSSLGSDGRVHPSSSMTTTMRQRLPADVIGRGRPGSALSIDATNNIGWITLTPAHTTRPWNQMLTGRAENRSLVRATERSR